MPIAWVFLERYHPDGVTVRWRRGEAVAYILDGKRLGDHRVGGILAKIPVAPAGWTDSADIRMLGQRWLRQQPISRGYLPPTAPTPTLASIFHDGRSVIFTGLW